MELAEVWRGKETLLTVRLHLGGASGGIRVITLEHGVIGLLFIAELVTSLEPHAAVRLKAADHANILTWLHRVLGGVHGGVHAEVEVDTLC